MNCRSPRLAAALVLAAATAAAAAESAPGASLAQAEQRFFERRYDACLRLLVDGEADAEASDRRDYLIAVSRWMIADRKGAAETLGRLLADAPALDASLGVARRTVIERMRREIAAGEPAPLAVVAGVMNDAGRRLALGDAGPPTERQQEQAVERLDRLIDELERQQQANQQTAAQGGGAPGGAPADDSRPSDGKGEGRVDRRRFAAGDAWGALSPAEREKLTQAITRDFPDHYRGLIERYFETLADPASRPAGPDGEAQP